MTLSGSELTRRAGLPGLLSMVVLAMTLFMAGDLSAQPTPPPAQTAEQQQAVGPVNQRQALDRVRARFPGEVISINEVRQGDRIRFRVRLDNEGNIYTVYVDKATGVVSRE
ncbi:PepSY domain-containing protein [Pseudohongiella spirulinae]|uniref:PepSY domain-containing protein n=1 Tax=Pseudohongiella spirulinae TaxID=1249552 RepID=A0A0S2KF95_9GAMM|nr:PepSY domain-containing protein [Pseudohongiella spirulinae]ALO46782.1 hypothetical protein PS2015_2145 [Pseudohongiella spirulinae]